MQEFDHVLNWKLKTGSHRFPGPDGGTCINEAALVAAGFEYRPIQYVGQMPPCFSRPICRFAMWLNDRASDAERQLLLPFITRLACADVWWVELKRWAYIELKSPWWNSSVRKGLETLEGALAIGRQADPLGPAAMHARLEAAKGTVPAACSKPDPALPKKVKWWFTADLEHAD